MENTIIQKNSSISTPLVIFLVTKNKIIQNNMPATRVACRIGSEVANVAVNSKSDKIRKISTSSIN